MKQVVQEIVFRNISVIFKSNSNEICIIIEIVIKYSRKKVIWRQKMKKFIGIILSLMITAQVHASISVAPTRLEINANKVKSNYVTTAIDVRGDDKKAMRFKAYTGYFILNDKGEFVDSDNLKGAPDDISKKVRFVPSEFNVPAGKIQKLRVNIANLNSLPEGESRAVLYIEDVNPKEYPVNTGNLGIGAQLIVKTRVAVPIYVDKGNFTKKAEIENFSLSKDKQGIYTNLKIKSTGSTRVRYTARIQVIQGKKLLEDYPIYGTAVPAGKTFEAKDKMKLENVKDAGEYTVRAVVTFTDEKGKKQNI